MSFALYSAFPNAFFSIGVDPFLDIPIFGVFAVCQAAPVQCPAQDKVNHWRIFFVLDEVVANPISGGRSIAFDMHQLSAKDTMGQLSVTLREYNVPPSPERMQEISLLPQPGLTVRHVLAYLRNTGFLNYRFTADGEGSRFWVHKVLRNLVDKAGYLSEPLLPKIDVMLQRMWLTRTQAVYAPLNTGGFF